MLRPLPVAALTGLTLAASITASSPAAACSMVENTLPYGPTFAGRTIPLNGELWILNARMSGVTTYLFTAPDGTEHLVDTDGVDDALLFTEVPLIPGAWQLADTIYGQEWSFEVSDTVDDAPPAAPAVEVETFSRGGPATLIFGCGNAIPTSRRRFTITVDPAEVGQVMVADRRYLVEDDTVTIETADDGVAYDFTVIDHAGNESEAVSLGGGGGCASMPASTSLFAALLLIVRRRRSQP